MPDAKLNRVYSTKFSVDPHEIVKLNKYKKFNKYIRHNLKNEEIIDCSFFIPVYGQSPFETFVEMLVEDDLRNDGDKGYRDHIRPNEYRRLDKIMVTTISGVDDGFNLDIRYEYVLEEVNEYKFEVTITPKIDVLGGGSDLPDPASIAHDICVLIQEKLYGVASVKQIKEDKDEKDEV